jgi:hypothetical protein
MVEKSVHVASILPSEAPRQPPISSLGESSRPEQANVGTSLTVALASAWQRASRSWWPGITGPTAVFTSRPLLAEGCTSPYYALVTGQEPSDLSKLTVQAAMGILPH